jgi:pilus assembly protein Flp/PilA
MTKIARLIAALRADRRAAAAIEYGLIAAVIGGVVISSATSFGNSLSNAYTSIGSTLASKAAGM